MNINSKDVLKSGPSYMLRDDGEIFDAGEAHPYLIYDLKYKEYIIFSETFASDWWIWFYEHTNNEDTKKLIIKCLKILYTLNVKDLLDSTYSLVKNYKNIFEYFNISDKDIINDVKSFDDFELYAESLNKRINQEFCRFRLGGKFSNITNSPGSIYFRIGSKGFNWFNLIWTLVYNNRDNLSEITIVRDRQALGKEEVITIKGKEIIYYPVESFLELPGNPVVESFNGHKNTRTYL